MRSIGVLPGPLKTQAARFAASARTFNLTISNVVGPRVALYAAGARVEEIYPVIPLSDAHALAVGVLSYGDYLHFALHVAPRSLVEVDALPDWSATRSPSSSARCRSRCRRCLRGAGPARYASSRSASSRGRLSAGVWPPSISSAVRPRRSRASRRMNSAGKTRSSRHSRKRVGTSGQASRGHGSSAGPPASSRAWLSAAAARSGATSW